MILFFYDWLLPDSLQLCLMQQEQCFIWSLRIELTSFVLCFSSPHPHPTIWQPPILPYWFILLVFETRLHSTFLDSFPLVEFSFTQTRWCSTHNSFFSAFPKQNLNLLQQFIFCSSFTWIRQSSFGAERNNCWPGIVDIRFTYCIDKISTLVLIPFYSAFLVVKV